MMQSDIRVYHSFSLEESVLRAQVGSSLLRAVAGCLCAPLDAGTHIAPGGQRPTPGLTRTTYRRSEIF